MSNTKYPAHNLGDRIPGSLPKSVVYAIRDHCLKNTGMTKATWYNVMAGNVPHPYLIAELCTVFEVTIQELLDPAVPLDADVARRVLNLETA